MFEVEDRYTTPPDKGALIVMLPGLAGSLAVLDLRGKRSRHRVMFARGLTAMLWPASSDRP